MKAMPTHNPHGLGPSPPDRRPWKCTHARLHSCYPPRLCRRLISSSSQEATTSFSIYTLSNCLQDGFLISQQHTTACKSEQCCLSTRTTRSRSLARFASSSVSQPQTRMLRLLAGCLNGTTLLSVVFYQLAYVRCKSSSIYPSLSHRHPNISDHK